ncbi:hypothetical protein CBR_g2974 [Chara braunii]|uniref:50S ribosomal protein L13 n=1 Tax=Chara braunii TaxID=69332 RepID=A0A388KEF0_CHABU|nr:hypothetical protein CBR_g2974 [Chara braunii]|eukprot:GBG68430.1 hypothetical protein CBR_g2974 [Chara braunii]
MAKFRVGPQGLQRALDQGLRWRLFNAKDQVLGRIATQIAVVLMGKDKPTYTPNKDDGDVCVVVNAQHVALTGRKMTDKVYKWHTGYPGGLKERTVAEQMMKDPTEVIRKAVLRMLPRNKLRDDRSLKLRIFNDDEHPFTSQQLTEFHMPERTVREMRPREKRALKKQMEKAAAGPNAGRRRGGGQSPVKTPSQPQ